MNFEPIKTHFKKHKEAYIVGSACLLIGAATAVLIVTRKGVDVTVAQKGVFVNSPITNTVVTILERRGHPGNVIRCIETGEVFASQQRAAELLGLSAGNLSQHLSGKYAHVSGLTFEILGEAV